MEARLARKRAFSEYRLTLSLSGMEPTLRMVLVLERYESQLWLKTLSRRCERWIYLSKEYSGRMAISSDLTKLLPRSTRKAATPWIFQRRTWYRLQRC